MDLQSSIVLKVKKHIKDKMELEEKLMKRLLAGILAAALVGSAGVQGAAAACRNRGNCGTEAEYNFVDKNKDGICDNYTGKKGNFVDDDKDGVCDNYKKETGNGCGTGMKNGNGTGNGNRTGNGGGHRHNSCGRRGR